MSGCSTVADNGFVVEDVMRLADKSMIVFFTLGFALDFSGETALAQSAERFAGTLSCAKSAFAKPARREPITVEVAGGVARYRHIVLNEDGTAGVGMETGEGTIGKDGKATLAGAWKSQSGVYSYEARYVGTFGAKGGELAGNQAWTIHGRKGERSCTVNLSKRGRGFLRRY
jgi:hypothetical protein